MISLLSRSFGNQCYYYLILLVIPIAQLFAQEKMKIGGKGTLLYTKQETIEISDVKNHLIFVSQFKGINQSTGEAEFMNGALLSIIGYGDYVNGIGPHHGYSILTLGGDTVYAKYEGETKTIVDLEGNAIFTKGTGKYKNIQGNYKYSAKLITKQEMLLEWEGECVLGKEK